MKNKFKKIKFNKENLRDIPQENGVYVFWNDDSILYIGKAKNLKRRVASYKISLVTGKTKKLLNSTNYFSYVPVNSEIESLLLEAKLVKKFEPKYNIQLKDDKHPLYIRITNEEFPRIITARRKEEINKGDFLFGPFPSSRNVKRVLKILRRIFPYSQHKLGKRACFYSQIGQCDPCPNIIIKLEGNERSELKKQYKYNIKMIKGILNGRINFVKKDLTIKMRNHAKTENFEKANNFKHQLQMIEYITQPTIPSVSFLQNPNFIEDIRSQELKELQDIVNKYISIDDIERIECFDVAHLQGNQPTASMVTFINGEPEKSLYRHFKIKQKKGQDDTASLKEVASRRIKHLSDWGYPDLIIVDGGKGQVGVFNDVFKSTGIPVIGLAKRYESLVFPSEGEKKYIVRKVPVGNALNLLKRLRDEAHRFARRYHHKLLERILLQNT